MTAIEFVASAVLLQYRGEQYRMHSVGDDFARVVVDGRSGTPERFPDALAFGSDHDEQWVKLPLASFEASFDRRVSGVWHGAPVQVGHLFTSGPASGRVKVIYDGASPQQAIAAGLHGDQYNGWEELVDPAEVEISRVDLVKRVGFGDG